MPYIHYSPRQPPSSCPRLQKSPCQYLISSGSTKKKLVDHGKEQEGFKRHDEHREEEARAKQTHDNEEAEKDQLGQQEHELQDG
ncbi:hypothetical protein B0T13DRAFT_221498 [Neurospora crassa]|nr:hypothetical protein B0T13DRAFT_221498 [Neurospora crassa]